MRRTALALALLGAGLGEAMAEPTVEHGVVVLQGLDKVTARVSVLDLPIGDEIRFGSLAIRARACLETPPTEPPESAAFLEIDEVEAGEERRRVFTGWMFASTPGISALEHPVYDVWVIDCEKPLAVEEPAP